MVLLVPSVRPFFRTCYRQESRYFKGLCVLRCLLGQRTVLDLLPPPHPTPGVNMNTHPPQEYLRSLQRVTIRFHLDAFAGEFVGDVAIELFENCGCTLFALICTTCELRLRDRYTKALSKMSLSHRDMRKKDN